MGKATPGLRPGDYLVIIAVAVVLSVAGVLVQYLVFGEVNGPLAGGAAAGVAAVVGWRRVRRRASGGS
jgi:hypothetical protein